MTPAAGKATASGTVCPGCGARLPAADLGELTSWTQALGDPSFPHQHAVDAYAAQHASDRSPPMTAIDVLAAPDRLAALRDWAAAVWAAWEPEHARVRALVSETDLPAPRRRR